MPQEAYSTGAKACVESGSRVHFVAVHEPLVFVSESVEGRQLVAGTEIRVKFFTSEVRADAGCNWLSADYHIEGVVLHVSGYGATTKGCSSARHAQDDWFLKVLGSRPTLALAEPRLVMSTADERLTFLDREIASPDRPLAGTHWVGDGSNDGVTWGSSPNAQDVSVWFDPNGSVEVRTKCQIGAGSYQVQGSNLTFAGFSYDGAACANVSEQRLLEDVQLVLDGSSVSFAIEEVALEITKGKYTLQFRADEG
ncbi:MAG: META domain-containing protein [Polyangiaceae bacterium]|nr:META domain-containing protein [Polyangiaceae bacterium]